MIHKLVKTDETAVPGEELEEQLELAKVEIERLADQSRRRRAELISYRRRVQKEQAETVTMAQAALLGRIVPVIDDLERAVETRSEDASVYHEGMQIILHSVQKVLETIGVERIMPEGVAFDPRYHESIARHETNEVPEGQVFDVVQPGYRLKDRLIRPASVVVSCGSTTVEGDTAEDKEEAQALPVKIAVAVAMADGALADSEGKTIKRWITRSIEPYEDEERERLKNLYNDAFKDAYAKAKTGKLLLKELVDRLNEIGERKVKEDAVRLCFDLGADVELSTDDGGG